MATHPRREAADDVRRPRRAPRASLLSTVLTTVLEAVEPVSRAEVAARTGLSRATVSVMADQLLSAGLVRELDPVVLPRAGRPAVPLAPARGTVAAVGMEVNVDYLGLRAIDLAGRVLTERLVVGDLRGSDPGEVLDRLAGLSGRVVATLEADGVRVAGTALALPGLVDRVTGPLRLAPNLGWRDVDVVGLMSAHPVLHAFPPRVANEANLAARAEAAARRGRGTSSFVYVSGEVGIGAAIVLDGQIFTGRHGWSGELGHVVVEPSLGVPEGTLERLAGQDVLLRAAGLPADAPVTALVAALAGPADPEVVRAVTDAGARLGYALASVVNIVDVGEVVLGGTFGQLYDHLHQEVSARLAEAVIFAPWSEVRVVRALAGDLPAMTGGALSVLAGVAAEPEAWVE